MIVKMLVKVAEVKIPVQGNLEHMPVVSGIEISTSMEIEPSEFPAYTEVVKGHLGALVSLLEQRSRDLS